MNCSIDTVNFTFWKYNGKFIVFLFYVLTKTLQKIIRIVIWTFSVEICFWNQFWTSGSGQTENMQIRVFADFQFDHFPKSKINSIIYRKITGYFQKIYIWTLSFILHPYHRKYTQWSTRYTCREQGWTSCLNKVGTVWIFFKSYCGLRIHIVRHHILQLNVFWNREKKFQRDNKKCHLFLKVQKSTL